MSTTRPSRAQLDLTPEQAEKFRRGLEHTGATGTTVLVAWITQAARYAHEGHVALLPAKGSAEAPWPDVETLTYSLSIVERVEARELLDAAGSSVRDVVVACIEAWEMADWSLVRMSWPGRNWAKYRSKKIGAGA